MREIKFRGKRTNNDEWIIGDLSVRLDEGVFIWIWKTGDTSKYGFEVIPETVGQYTGLKDGNGVEIYEGDVIEFQVGYYKAKRNRMVSGVVEFIDGCFKIKKYDMPLSAIELPKIIGNIYDNPELLEEK